MTFLLNEQYAQNGILDFDIVGAYPLKRVKLPLNTQKGDVINIYYGDSSKSGIQWRGTLKKSVSAFLKTLAK